MLDKATPTLIVSSYLKHHDFVCFLNLKGKMEGFLIEAMFSINGGIVRRWLGYCSDMNFHVKYFLSLIILTGTGLLLYIYIYTFPYSMSTCVKFCSFFLMWAGICLAFLGICDAFDHFHPSVKLS